MTTKPFDSSFMIAALTDLLRAHRHLITCRALGGIASDAGTERDITNAEIAFEREHSELTDAFRAYEGAVVPPAEPSKLRPSFPCYLCDAPQRGGGPRVDGHGWCEDCGRIRVSIEGQDPVLLSTTDLAIEDARVVAATSVCGHHRVGGGAQPETIVIRMADAKP